MTELEVLTQRTARRISECVTIKYAIEITSDALVSAYQLGRADCRTQAQREAEKHLRRNGRKAGAKDNKPRHRRSKAEMEADKNKEMK